jgi:crotonobetaine/carnitine-CoA ligase
MGFQIWSADKQDTVTAVLSRAAEQFPERTLLDFQGDKYTYAEVDEKSTQLAHGLLARGVASGDRVGSILDSNLDAVLLWFAVNKIGAINVPINTAYKGEFLRHQFASAGCRIMVAESDYARRVIDVSADLPEGELMLVRGEVVEGNSYLNTESFSNAYNSNTDRIEDNNKPSDLCMLIFTGGTTGPSKACMISHNYACNIAQQILKRESRTKEDVNWTPLPLFHMNATAGSILSCMMVGAAVSIFPRFSVSGFWPDVERSGATVVNLLGAMIGFIANAPDNESSKRYFGKLKAVRGAPFPPELQELWKTRFGVKSAGSNGYGLTEAARVTSLPDGMAPAPGSSGRVNEDFDVRIVDDNDIELPAGQAGEIIIRPRHPHIMFEGYWNQPKETLEIMNNLWLHSGDIGKFDVDGFFYFVDRKKDYLRRRGENISSFEMETALRAHPMIDEVAVHAVLADSEDEVKVTAILVGDADLDEEELCRWCIDRMPYFAVPRFIEFRTEMPRSPLGRILKYQLRDQGCTLETWDREASDLELTKR